MDLQVVGSADFDQDAQKVYPFLYKLLIAEFLLGCLVPQLTDDLVKLHMIVAAKHTSRNPHKHVVKFVYGAPTSKVNGIVLVEVTVLGEGFRELQDALQHYLHVALEEPQYLIFLHREQLLQWLNGDVLNVTVVVGVETEGETTMKREQDFILFVGVLLHLGVEADDHISDDEFRWRAFLHQLLNDDVVVVLLLYFMLQILMDLLVLGFDVLLHLVHEGNAYDGGFGEVAFAIDDGCLFG